MKYTKIQVRIAVVTAAFILLFFVLLAKITYLQLFRKDFFRRLGDSQHMTLVPVKGARGSIYDREGRPLAVNLVTCSVYADPKMVDDPDRAALTLSVLLDLDKNKLARKLRSKRRFVWIKRMIPLEEKEKLQDIDISGVGFLREKKRVYLQSGVGAHILGGVNIDNKGIEGIELRYDRYLKGKEGLITSFRDSSSRKLIFSPQLLHPEQGADLFLTIDAQIQYWADTFLKESVEKFNAGAGSVAVLDADSGEVLALSNYPSFDPNRLGSFRPEQRRNRAITDIFEPGSVFKIVTLSGALDSCLYKESDIIFCENGAYKIPGTVLHDYHSYGDLSFSRVFKKSSNIGTAKIAHKLGAKKLYDYICGLGFGRKTGIDLPGESCGLVKKPQAWSKTSPYIIPIGQEVGVTVLQMAKAMSIIANGGWEITPFVVRKIVHNKFFREFRPERKRVLPQWVSLRAQNILSGVVEDDGTGRKARIRGVKCGGKTGTAQKYDPELGGYSPDKYRASFAGFIKTNSRTLAIAVSIDEPVKSHLGGVIAAPLFKSIGAETVRYLENKQIEKKMSND